MIDPADVDVLKRQIEAQIGDYEQSLAAYAAFMDDWRSRNSPEGKRIRRFRKAARPTEAAAE